jgi:hypothetical protein
MPKLPLDWEWDGKQPFLEAEVVDLFETFLPTAEELQVGEVDPYFKVDEDEYASDGMKNFASMSVRSLYGVGHSRGIESFRLQGVGDFANGIIDIVNQPAMAQMRALAKQAVVDGLDTAFGAIGAVPIVGWAVNIAWRVANVIHSAVEAFKNEKDAIPLDAITADDVDDQSRTRKVLRYATVNDWTQVFLPAIQPDSFTREKITWDGKFDGWRVKPQGRDLDGHGVIPGMPLIMSGTFQMPYAYSDKEKWVGNTLRVLPDPPYCGWAFGPNFCSQTGSFIPSASQAGFTLWSMVRKNSASAFKIDQSAILSAWRDFFEALFDYTRWRYDQGGRNDLQTSWALQLLSSCADCMAWKRGQFTCSPFPDFDIPGFGTEYIQEIADHRGVLQKAIQRDGHLSDKGSMVSFQALVEFFVRDQLRAVSQSFVNTITVAYVDETFPTIANNTPIRRKWEENREKLLTHPAVHDVEPDLVPDPYYRSRVEQMQRLGGTKLLGEPVESTPIIYAVPVDRVPYPRPAIPDRFLAPATKRKDKGLSAVQKLTLAVLFGGGAYWLFRRYRPELTQFYRKTRRRLR